jgi:ATP-dependent Lon protease
MIVREMIKASNWRCVIVFDEIDKIGKKNDTNDVSNQLIHITDPNSNASFKDRFFSSSIDFDLSGALMICLYNDRDKIDPVLHDRFHEVEVKPYSINEKIDIVNQFLLKEVCGGIGFNHEKIHMSYETIRYIIENHTVEAGVRNLKRILETILLKLNIDRIYLRGPFRKIIMRIIKKKSNESPKYDDIWSQELKNFYNDVDDFTPNKYLTNEEIDEIYNMQFKNPISIDNELVLRYINKSNLEFTEIHKNNLIGVVNGLYATSIGTGGIVPIQILPNYFGGKHSGVRLKLTGSQGNEMIESITCAFNIAIHLLSDKHKKAFLNKYPNGFHVHTPSISSPKDGPSAGCAFATAFVSIIIGKKINRFISMTGEIEATGRVTKIGGLLYKLTGAKRAGVKLIFICKENEDDYNDIKKKYPDLFNDGLEVKIIEHIYQIISNPLVILNINSNDFNKEIWKEYMMTSSKTIV